MSGPPPRSTRTDTLLPYTTLFGSRVALRGSASTGFRAPSLAQQFFATTSTNNVAGTLIEVGTFPVSNPVSVALGSKPLKAEKSTNLGGGIALNPISGLSLTADYYNIKEIGRAHV